MSGGQLGHLLLAVSVGMGAAGHTLLKHIVASIPALSHLLVPSYVFSVAVLGRLLLAFLLLVISFGAWLGALRHLDLSYSYAMASISILIVAVLAAALLGETIAPKAWLGLVLVVVGCILIAPAYAGKPS